MNTKHKKQTIMREDDIETLEAETDICLAKWWCQLNRWGWPNDLKDPEPPNYIRDGRRSNIMRWIESRIGHKEFLRQWNIDTMPGESFDQWYDGWMR